MTGDWEGFREEIRNVEDARNMDDPKLALPNAITQPVKTHIQRLRHLGLDSVVGNADSNFVVAVDRRWGLRVAEVVKDFALLGGDAGGGENTAVFRLRHEGADYRNAGGVGVDGVV